MSEVAPFAAEEIIRGNPYREAVKQEMYKMSQGTAKAMEAISGFISLLANYYDKEKRGELELMDN